MTGYFYNPNIYPESEYTLRLSEAGNLAKKRDIELLCGEYDANEWFTLTKGMEQEPEGGSRCDVCFRMRLEKTAQRTRDDGFDIFTTTLTVSPHKNARLINEIGFKVAKQHGVDFLERDFKKRDGFKKTVRLSKEYGLYRQNYCGCLYSREERDFIQEG